MIGACATITTFGALYAINHITGGDWFFTAAAPIAGLALLYAWITAACLLSPMKGMHKAAAVFIVLGFANATVNPLVNRIISGHLNVAWSLWSVANLANAITFLGCIGIAVILVKLAGSR
jgi:hypothetical protein